MVIILSRKAENELEELAELLRELQQTLLRLNVTKDLKSRQVVIRKMSRLFAEIERNPIAPK
jgi:NurA-like 5'-3' nuclease